MWRKSPPNMTIFQQIVNEKNRLRKGNLTVKARLVKSASIFGKQAL